MMIKLIGGLVENLGVQLQDFVSCRTMSHRQLACWPPRCLFCQQMKFMRWRQLRLPRLAVNGARSKALLIALFRNCATSKKATGVSFPYAGCTDPLGPLGRGLLRLSDKEPPMTTSC